jgi:hypothetical protein
VRAHAHYLPIPLQVTHRFRSPRDRSARQSRYGTSARGIHPAERHIRPAPHGACRRRSSPGAHGASDLSEDRPSPDAQHSERCEMCTGLIAREGAAVGGCGVAGPARDCAIGWRGGRGRRGRSGWGVGWRGRAGAGRR